VDCGSAAWGWRGQGREAQEQSPPKRPGAAFTVSELHMVVEAWLFTPHS
jgi:hypothetical protein